MPTFRLPLILCLSLGLATAAWADARATLLAAAFQTRDKAQAAAQVAGALKESEAVLARDPANGEAMLQHALAVGYRGKLARKPGDAKQARREFEMLAQRRPRDPEVQMALGGWHLEAVAELGGFLAGSVLGAKKDAGYAAIDRAVALGGNRALFAAYAALIRIRVDPEDVARAAALAQRAQALPAPTAADRVFQQAAARIAVPLRAGDGKAASALARQLLPFGRLG